MTNELAELNSPAIKIEICGKVLTLEKFDLFARAWAYEEFATDKEPDGLIALAKRLELKTVIHDINAIAKPIYFLIKEKDIVGTYDDFIKLIDKDKRHSALLIKYLFEEGLNKSLKISEPSKDELEEDDELKKSAAAAR